MGEWLRHPWRSAGMVVEVARLHTAYVSAETVERRKRGIEDVTKRREFRKAHGLEEKRSGDEEVENTIATPTAVVATQEPGAGREAGSGVYTDWEGKRKPVKKWLGIW
ncbi:MAG: hypothetical protein M1832_003035 [Thelocarpon impressellum]|nr:MAG: hypothetical protein M1832_003035 [Thelocarpon impressellum]